MSEVDIARVPSPYAGTKLGMGTQVAISAYWFATNFLWGALLVNMLPDEVKRLVPEKPAPALAFLLGLSAIIALVVPLVAGALSDRCAARWGRRRPFMAVGIAINLVGLLLMVVALKASTPVPVGVPYLSSPSFLGFFFAFMVVQFGNNVTSAAYSGIIPDLVPADQRGTASGYMALMSQVGTLLGAFGSGVLLKHTDEGLKYLLLGFVLLAVGSVTLLGIKESPLPERPPRIQWGPYLRSLWIDPRVHPNFAWVWITRALVMLGFYAVVPYVKYFLEDVIHSRDAGKDAAMVMGIILVASSASAVIGGKISDKIGRRKVVYLANSIIAVMALGFIFCRNLEQTIAVGLLFGLGYGAYVSVDWALGTDVLPSKEDAAKEMAVWHIAMTLPQAIAAPAAAVLISAFKTTSTIVDGERVYHYNIAGYSAVFILCSVCFALGAFLLRNVRGVR